MRYMLTADTDIGIAKKINQDSICVMHADSDHGQVAMAVVCDGMGGLVKGELASATVVRAFRKWFTDLLPYDLPELDMESVAERWVLMLRELNAEIKNYGRSIGADLGTTFTGMLLADDRYLIVHVGDSRAYRIDKELVQLTEDHTLVAREVKRGAITPEQAKTDVRRSILLQCIGASTVVEPQVIHGKTEPGAYLLCSDGFRHRISEHELVQAFGGDCLTDKTIMHKKTLSMISLVKQRYEKDNISVILIKAE